MLVVHVGGDYLQVRLEEGSGGEGREVQKYRGRGRRYVL